MRALHCLALATAGLLLAGCQSLLSPVQQPLPTSTQRWEHRPAGCTGADCPLVNIDLQLPKGLRREQMSVQARLMAIADIFEALTAADRPYKKGKMLSEALHILGNFSLNGHIDPDLFDIFIRSKIYLEFARKNMDEKQIDAIDESRIPGYTP